MLRERRHQGRRCGDCVVHQRAMSCPMQETRGVVIIVIVAKKLCEPVYTFALLARLDKVSLSSHLVSLAE